MITEKMFNQSEILIKKMLDSYNETKLKIVLEPINNPVVTIPEFKQLIRIAYNSQLMDLMVFNAVMKIFDNWNTETILNKVLAMNVIKYMGRCAE